MKGVIRGGGKGKKVRGVVEVVGGLEEERKMKWRKGMEEEGVKVMLGVEGVKIEWKVVYME